MIIDLSIVGSGGHDIDDYASFAPMMISWRSILNLSGHRGGRPG